MTFKRAPHLFLLLYYSTVRRCFSHFLQLTRISHFLGSFTYSFIYYTCGARCNHHSSSPEWRRMRRNDRAQLTSCVFVVVVLWFHRYTMTSDGCSMRLVGSCKHSHRLGYSRDLCDACLFTFFIRAYHHVQWVLLRSDEERLMSTQKSAHIV